MAKAEICRKWENEMHVLVTGVSGFIGAALAERLLQRGDTITGIDNMNSYYTVELKTARLNLLKNNPKSSQFYFNDCDFSDASALNNAIKHRDFSAIVHLGAQAGVRYSLQNPEAYVQSNLLGHLNILEIARARAVQHLVYASSSSVYGSNSAVPFSVTDRTDNPCSLYAATKKADELMSESYSHLFRIRQTGLRFFTVYGPWGRPDMMPWIFTSKILNGEVLPVFNHGRMMRDFTFIDDIVTGIVSALDRPPEDDGQMKPGGSSSPHCIYNLGNNRPVELLDVISVIERACGQKAELEMLPMQNGDVPRTFADISEAARDLQFEPITSIEEGFPRFVSWYRNYMQV